MKIVPLFGTGVKGKSAIATAQRRLNCYWELRSDGDKQQAVLFGTPGTTVFVTLPKTPIRGIISAYGAMWAVANNTVYKIAYNGTITSCGTILTQSGNVSMDSFATVAVAELMIVDGGAGYIVDMNGLTTTQITDGNFPANPTQVAMMDGFFIVNGVGNQFLVSRQYKGSDWSWYGESTPGANDGNKVVGTVESIPWYVTTIISDHGNIIFGSEVGIEFWQNVGTFPLPFAPLRAVNSPYGINKSPSVGKTANTLAYLGYERSDGHLSIYALNGYTPTRISTPDIDNIISGFSVVDDAVGFGWTWDSHSFYQITFPTGNRTFLYDFTTQSWSELQTGPSIQARHLANFGVCANDKCYVTDATNGNIYFYDGTVYADNGTTTAMEVVSRHIDSDGNVFRLDEVWLDMETGVGLQSGQGSDPQIVMQVSKDGGRTWGYERWASFGRIGQYSSPRAIWRRNGAAHDIVLKFKITDPVYRVIARAALGMGQKQ